MVEGQLSKTVSILVWDFPLRAFHWLLVLSTIGMVITGKIGGLWMDWHGLLGVFVLGLLAFRIVWGFLGSTYARFARFLPTPGKVVSYLRGRWLGIGHNPLGALSVFALLAVLFLQVATGVFANDDIAFQGPLAALISTDTSNSATGLHAATFDAFLILVATHVLAVLYYAVFKRDDLIKAMITGHQRVPDALAQPAQGGGLIRFLVSAALAASLSWAVGSGAFVSWVTPSAAQPPPASQADW